MNIINANIQNKIFIGITIITLLLITFFIVTNFNPMNKIQNFQHIVTLETSLGNIRIKTYDADAPLATNNFITLIRDGFYDGIIFHRVIDGFMIQAGCPLGNGTGGPGYTFEDELNPNTESARKGYITGTVAMANAGPNTNGSQFFIMVADNPLPHAYTIFGRVIEGQDIANAISMQETNANDMPINEIRIIKATVEELNPNN